MVTPPRAYVFERERWVVRWGEWCLYALAYGFRIVTWPVPIWTLSGAFAPLGGLLARIVAKPRRRAEANLALVWPDRSAAERRRIVTGAGCAFMRLCVEYAHLDRWARTVRLETEGVAHLTEAADAGRGVVLVTAHYGNWEAIRLAALGAGVETGIIYRPFNNRYLDRYALNLITCAGGPVLQKGKTGVRELVTHLRRGGAILILVDQRTSGAPFLPFLGMPAETVLVAANLARLGGAALIPARARRVVERRCFDVRFETPVTVREPQAMMTEVNDRIGSWIEACPDQWLWFHRRWKTNTRSRGS